MEPAFPKFPGHCKALVKKHLTPQLFSDLKLKKTESGFTISKAIQSCLANPDSSIGFYAGDAQCYDTFSPLLNPMIIDYHHHERHGIETALEPIKPADPDPEGRYIRSTRIRLARNLSGHAFACNMPLEERKTIEKKSIQAFKQLSAPLNGNYFAFETCDKKTLSQLQQQGMAFGRGDRFQEAAGLNDDFPKGRGVFLSNDKKFIVWVNEEDHLRIISLEKSGRMETVFQRLCSGINALNQHLDFCFHNQFGFLTSCPTNIGTTMRAGVHIRLENLEKHPDLLDRITKAHHLQIRGTGGEKTRVESAVFDISNQQRLGISEAEIVRNLMAGIARIIEAEKNWPGP